MSVLNNPKHELFVQELAKGKSATEAYSTAGYTPHRHNAANLARKEHIKARVTELLIERDKIHVKATEKAMEALAIDREWVMGRLIENAERALQAVEVKDAKGNRTGEYRYEGAVANRALELLGKELGMFIDRSRNEHSFDVSLAEALDALKARRAPDHREETSVH